MEEKIAESILGTFGLPVLLLLGLASLLVTIVRESRKLREEVSYQVNRDLLERRFEAYGKLWSRMKTIAIYGDGRLEADDVSKFRHKLAAWYFSEHGGLYLTKRARTFYFALQDMLAKTSRFTGWTCPLRPDTPKELFLEVLQHVEGGPRIAGLLEDTDSLTAQEWTKCCESVTDYLRELVESKNEHAGELIFASIQQVSSVLRTVLTSDVRSRLDLELPAR